VKPTPWILKHPIPANAQIRLLCLPFAGGGGSAFRPWCELLAPEIEVVPIQLPGRENRLNEPAFDSFAPTLAALADLIESVAAAGDYALFGHSAGAHLAFLLTRQIRAQGLTMPRHLFLSSRRAVHLPNATPLLAPLDDDSFLAEVIKRYGADAQVQDKDLYQLMLPAIRADIAATETHPYVEEAALDCPISVFGGDQDDWVPLESLQAWEKHSAGPFTLKTFPGGHFYLNAARGKLLGQIRKSLLTKPS